MITTVIVELKVEHDEDTDPFDVVDTLLDNGVPQDSINEHECEDQGDCHVTSAISFSVSGYQRRLEGSQ